MIFDKRNVSIEAVDTASRDIDRFMSGCDSFETAKRSWQVDELTQTQDAHEWIESPDKISLIQSNMQVLVTHLKKLMKPVRLLDVGCYGGYLYDYLIRHGVDVDYTGIDIVPAAVEAAAKAHKDTDARFMVGDVYDLSQFKNNEFDVVCCYRVLIHIPFWERALSNLCRVGKSVHCAIKIGKQLCTKYKETDLDTGVAATYFIRSVSEGILGRLSRKLKTEWSVIPAKHYSTVIFGEQPKD